MFLNRSIAISLRLFRLLAIVFFGLLSGRYDYLPHDLEPETLPQLAGEAGIAELWTVQ
jgi:hypothetical protein